MIKPAISVFTATWNRAHVLHRAYDSLCRQTVKDFEWIIVDDGSIDNTADLVLQWISKENFPIFYYNYCNNRGQIPAENIARKLTNGEYILKLDSDDSLVDNAIETIISWRYWSGIDEIDTVMGFAFRCIDENGNLVGKLKGSRENFPRQIMQLSIRKARYDLGINFDVVNVIKSDVFEGFQFGELNQSEHFPESVFWNGTSNHYEFIYVDHPIRIYYQHDGVARLSDNTSKSVKWPRGNYLRALAILNEDIDYLRHSPKVFMNAARKITRLGLHIGRSPRSQFRDLAHTRARLLWATGLPGGLVGYVRDRMRGRTAPKADPDISAWGPAIPPENPVLYPPPG